MWFCRKDPLASYLRDNYGAQLLQVPNDAMKPGRLLQAPNSLKSPGILDDLVTGPTLNLRPLISGGDAADIASKKSGKLEGEVSANILEGVLSAIGLDAPASVKATFSSATATVYSFNNVKFQQLQMIRLDEALLERPLDTRLDFAKQLVAGGNFCMVDSIFTSQDLNMSMTHTDSVGFEASAKALSEALGEVTVEIQKKSRTSLEIRFKGEKALAFAYSQVSLTADKSGRIRFLEELPEAGAFGGGIYYAFPPSPEMTDAAHAPHIVFGNDPVFIGPTD